MGRLVAARLYTDFIDLDEVAEPFYEEVGWSIPRLVDRAGAVGRLAAEREWEVARAHAVVRVLDKHPDAVIALGAGHTSYLEARHRSRVLTALESCRFGVWMQPSPHRELSLAILRERCLSDKSTSWIVQGHDLLGEWLDSAKDQAWVRKTVYSVDRSPEQVADEIARHVRDPRTLRDCDRNAVRESH